VIVADASLFPAWLRAGRPLRCALSSDAVELPVRAPLLLALGAALAASCSSSPRSPGEGPADATTPPGQTGFSDAGVGSPFEAGPGYPLDAAIPPSQGPVPDGGGCGYRSAGVPLHVADQIDLCLPPVACTSETCPPELGDCVNDQCVFHAGYLGVATLPEAWSTYYCQLSTGGCHGITQLEYPEVTAGKIATAKGYPLCDQASGGGECVGIAAAPAMIVGNSQEAVDSATRRGVADWGLGLTEASGLCYELTGPGGKVLVALTDRCGGYCACSGSSFEECGPCVNAADMKLQCPCVGTVPSTYTNCCGTTCGGTVNPQCDWCASNNHAHFDLDLGTFNHLCGASAVQGSCRLTGVSYTHCLDAQVTGGWPPGGGGSARCAPDSFACASPQPHQDQVPATGCCCNWNACPAADGSCAAAPANCSAGSCACAPGQPDGTHAKVASTGCCCLSGLSPQADGTCN